MVVRSRRRPSSPPSSTPPRRPAARACWSASTATAAPPSCRSRFQGRFPLLVAGNHMRILIVEDDLEAAEAMARGLTEAGHDITRGNDGEEGLVAARDGDFDVMVVDRMMPRMDGVQLVQTLRREGDRIPVLFLSALGEVSDRV